MVEAIAFNIWHMYMYGIYEHGPKNKKKYYTYTIYILKMSSNLQSNLIGLR